MPIPNGIVTIGSIEGFNKLVNAYLENLIVVDFFADWCVPCKTFLPIFEKTQQIYYPKGVIFARINNDQFPEVSRQFGIEGVPTLLLIRNKKGLKKIPGALNSVQLRQTIDSFL